MEAAIEIGQELGYIQAPKDTFIDAHQMNRLPANRVTILCTGHKVNQWQLYLDCEWNTSSNSNYSK